MSVFDLLLDLGFEHMEAYTKWPAISMENGGFPTQKESNVESVSKSCYHHGHHVVELGSLAHMVWLPAMIGKTINFVTS